ncbi:hypothetical protein CsSME_00013400 [Camellia sinensis var. sinensis]
MKLPFCSLHNKNLTTNLHVCMEFRAHNTCFSLFRDVDFEMIIVDDGSPDGTQDVVKKLQEVYGEDRIVNIIKANKDILMINDFFSFLTCKPPLLFATNAAVES